MLLSPTVCQNIIPITLQQKNVEGDKVNLRARQITINMDKYLCFQMRKGVYIPGMGFNDAPNLQSLGGDDISTGT